MGLPSEQATMLVATVRSAERIEAARTRVETLRTLVWHEMLPMNGTMHPEEVLPQYEEACAELARLEAIA